MSKRLRSTASWFGNGLLIGVALGATVAWATLEVESLEPVKVRSAWFFVMELEK